MQNLFLPFTKSKSRIGLCRKTLGVLKANWHNFYVIKIVFEEMSAISFMDDPL